MFQESNFAIVADNARSHGIVTNPRLFGDSRATARHSNGKKRSSRWECVSAKKDNVPIIKSLRASSSWSSSGSVYETTGISLNNVIKPVRRRSIDSYKKSTQIFDYMKQMNTSLSSMDGVIDERCSTASILSMALDKMELFEVVFGDTIEQLWTLLWWSIRRHCSIFRRINIWFIVRFYNRRTSYFRTTWEHVYLLYYVLAPNTRCQYDSTFPGCSLRFNRFEKHPSPLPAIFDHQVTMVKGPRWVGHYQARTSFTNSQEGRRRSSNNFSFPLVETYAFAAS